MHVIHYLVDYVINLPPRTDWRPVTARFKQLVNTVGLKIMEQKNEKGSQVSFRGVIFDTKSIAICLPASKKDKGLAIIRKHKTRDLITLLDLQELTGFLDFTTLVVPLGRAFLRRLYNLQLFLPPGCLARRLLSAEAQKDLTWWENLLSFHATIERQFQPTMRRDFRMWTYASGLECLGGDFQEDERGGIHDIQPRAAFMLALPRHIEHKQEHINSKEMREVEQGLLRCGDCGREAGSLVISTTRLFFMA